MVSLDDKDEKILNISLNKVKGCWDIGKLTDLLRELDNFGDIEITGFDDNELQDFLKLSETNVTETV